MTIQINTSNASPFLPQDWLDSRLDALAKARTMLEQGNGPGGSFTGWVHLPRDYDRTEFDRIQAAAAKIRADSQALVVIGIGGSYLGARAVVELLHSPNYNLIRSTGGPDLYFAGNGLSTDGLLEIIDLVKDRDFSLNVISKSGTTTEPAVAFRILKALLEQKYGKEEARRRIYATTDARRGALKGLADTEGYEEFVVPDAVGGRYSVLTAVGLLPIACAGIDLAALMDGACSAMEALAVPGADNPAWQYAAARHALYQAGKRVEVLAGYEPSFRFFAEWWKQLYGESEGKEHKGLFPASVEFTADLHSMGQYIQQGERLLFETVVRFARSRGRIAIPHDPENVDGLNFLSGKDLEFVSRQAMRGVTLAHVDGGVPNLALTVPGRDARSVGALIYFFEYACGLSGYLLGVNPFDQPGVEAYKNNMYALLGKPGYEARRAELEARL
ncbi:glucose-6-phosphate isomerase [Flavonifractor sp. DFI.6.63]|uniref:Glucose-6-phosphate isomerase n=2 Tax=Eubacteriales TaxID=186802 RepID=A0A8J6MBE6_9FIRM|nr:MULTISPECIES: glucose-6-phosphate isomerase [Oscillospiraceae]MBS1384541.1 glucose-6-phosphate isomerase [Flavonifractor sp.]MDU2195021.1 glucose-6-phosphate isomerase [Clostridiales bacterium]MDY2976989.1 glucose-6-phosphate isomerase [Oscillospiraceae bacterium]MBC5735004.1 glucose-6-phosphate isomerase [Lawsonibacter hominis]MCI6398276.1 glucose-6-phosphate isomerase [Lawsonibacter sp.]